MESWQRLQMDTTTLLRLLEQPDLLRKFSDGGTIFVHANGVYCATQPTIHLEECSICMNQYISQQLQCGHKCCNECAPKLLEIAKCPFCRRPIKCIRPIP